MYKLRYYLSETESYKEKNENVLQLLNLIKGKYGLDYETFSLRLQRLSESSLYTDEAHEREIYEKHFRPRAKTLSQRMGISLKGGLRSRSGHYYLAGILAILENGQVGWYTCWESTQRFKIYNDDGEIGFLKGILEEGKTLLEELCPAITSSPHDILIDAFIESGILKGKFEREVKVGQTIFKMNKGVLDWRKSIDLVCHTDKGTWIFEVKPKLNWEAFGQVVAYGYLYEKEKGLKISRGIICDDVDQEILYICKEFEISVFKRTLNKFEEMEA